MKQVLHVHTHFAMPILSGTVPIVPPSGDDNEEGNDWHVEVGNATHSMIRVAVHKRWRCHTKGLQETPIEN